MKAESCVKIQLNVQNWQLNKKICFVHYLLVWIAFTILLYVATRFGHNEAW